MVGSKVRRLLVCAALWAAIVHPLKATDLLFFYETGCPRCARVRDFLEKRIKPHYPVDVREYEIHVPENAALMLRLAQHFKAPEIIEKGTPAVFIGKHGFQGHSRRILREIEVEVRAAVRSRVVSPLEGLDQEAKNIGGDAEPGHPSLNLTLPAVLGAAALDAVNPCACAVLVLLLGTILVARRRRRRYVLGAGFAFTLACYISYFLMGLGLFAAVRAAGIQRGVYIGVSILAVLLGLWNIKTAVFRDERFRIEVPRSWQPAVKRLTAGVTSVPGAFFVGILISLFLLPCTSGPYVVIIGMLSRTASRWQAVQLLLLYNFVFILPFLIITLGVGFGLTTTAKVERWRQNKRDRLHLFTGVFLILLGVGLWILLALKAV